MHVHADYVLRVTDQSEHAAIHTEANDHRPCSKNHRNAWALLRVAKCVFESANLYSDPRLLDSDSVATSSVAFQRSRTRPVLQPVLLVDLATR